MAMRSVDFIYFPGCPNVDQARAHLLAAFTAIAVEPRWVEWDASDPATPDEFRQHGSPTVLVNGRDVAGAEPLSGGNSCRVYETADGLSGAPPVALLVQALRAVPAAAIEPAAATSGWRRALAVLPSLGTAAIPVGACPVCVAGYAGLFGALGLGFLRDARVLMPLTGVALVLALASLAWRARSRQGFGPLMLGVAGALALVIGQFAIAHWPTTVLGAVALLVAAVWNVWPRRRGDCTACAPQEEAR